MTSVHESKISLRDFKSAQRLIYDLAGIALSDSKQIMVQSRLAKRLRELKLDSYSDYLDLLMKDPDSNETIKFINALTTNKTDFFREKHHFDYLHQVLFPEIRDRAQKGAEKKVRIWCAASSTGEEPYTLAMSVREFFGTGTEWDVRILASDIDTDVLQTAINGTYPVDRFLDVPAPLMKKYFSRQSKEEETPWTARPCLKELITFRRLNLQQPDWPIQTYFDVIFCRNVMIYFDSPTQKRLVERFYDQLVDDGHLIIGHSESLFGLSDKFKPVGDTMYRKASTQTESPILQRIESRVASRLSSGINQQTSCQSENVASPQRNQVKHPTSSDRLPLMSQLRQRLGSEKRYPIIVGEVRANHQAEWITTLLGSCIATCLYDDVAKVGGMNHFMLPESKSNPSICATFGVHAMEMLINAIMKKGGDRRRLKAKIFGGGAVIPSQERWNIGARNIEFATNFLKTEGIPIEASHTGGDCGMQIHFHTHTAKVLVRMLDQSMNPNLIRDERRHAESFDSFESRPEDITLF